jgi:hypothetical protein
MRKTTLVTAVLGLSLAAAGCVTHEREVVERPPAPNCHGALWVQDGNHGHWDCPAEKVEVKVVP